MRFLRFDSSNEVDESFRSVGTLFAGSGTRQAKRKRSPGGRFTADTRVTEE